jgi:transposase, IS30 family
VHSLTEGDLIIGVGSASAMVTLRERTTQYGIIINLPHDHTATSVNTAVTGASTAMPTHIVLFHDIGDRCRKT